MPKGSGSGFHRASPFATKSFKTVPGEGPAGHCQCLLIGERPGEAESRVGRPFVGPAGKYLEICLSCANINRADLWITNLVRTFRYYAKPTADELARDHGELVAEILDHTPIVIGLVGGWAVEEVLRVEKAEMDKCHGCPKRLTTLFGGELEYECVVMPILHPSQANYSPDSLPLILSDFLTLGKLLDGEIEIVEDDYDGCEDYRVITGDELGHILG